MAKLIGQSKWTVFMAIKVDARQKLSQARFAAMCHEHFDVDVAFDHDTKQWYTCEAGDNWRLDKTGLVFLLASELAVDVSAIYKNSSALEGSPFLQGALEILAVQKDVAVTQSDWHPDDYKVGAPGGTIDLRATVEQLSNPDFASAAATFGRVRPADPDERIYRRLAVDPADEENCEQWKALVLECADGDPERARFQKRLFGLCLTGDMSEQVFVYMIRPAAAGQDAISRTISRILGGYAVTSASSAFVNHCPTHPTDLAFLDGAHLAVFPEIDMGGRWKEGNLDRVIGAYEVMAQKTRADFYPFHPRCKLLFVGNSLPSVAHVTPAMRRRFLVLPVEGKSKMVDRQLEKALRDEWPGILRWMLNGCLDWQREGLCVPEAVRVRTDEYFAEQDILQQFLNEFCTVRNGEVAPTAELFRFWLQFLKDRSEETENMREFGRRLTMAGFKSQTRHINGVSVSYSIGLRLGKARG